MTCHVLDIYHRHAIEKVHHAKAVCSAHLPEGPWDVVKFKTGPKIHSGELSLDLLQECHRFGCKVEVEFEGRERDRNDLLNKIKDDPKRVRSFKAEWPASVPGGRRFPGASGAGRTRPGGRSRRQFCQPRFRAGLHQACDMHSERSHRGRLPAGRLPHRLFPHWTPPLEDALRGRVDRRRDLLTLVTWVRLSSVTSN